MWVRYLLVSGWTDDLEAVAGLADFVTRLATGDQEDILPFHELSGAMHEALGTPSQLRNAQVLRRSRSADTGDRPEGLLSRSEAVDQVAGYAGQGL